MANISPILKDSVIDVCVVQPRVALNIHTQQRKYTKILVSVNRSICDENKVVEQSYHLYKKKAAPNKVQSGFAYDSSRLWLIVEFR